MLDKGKTVLLIVLLIAPLLILPSRVGFDFLKSGGQYENDSKPASPYLDRDAIMHNNSGIAPNQYSNQYFASAETSSGVLDPITVEQRGYYSSGNISARTDTGINTGTNLLLDTAHNWIADEAEAYVWNLQKLYAANGSYDEGFPGINVFPAGSVDYHPVGWDANSTDTTTYSDDVQLAAYDSSGREFVTVESQGGKEGQNAFGHVAATRIVWIQNVTNAPYTEDFVLSFDYFYLRGPIDGPTGANPLTGNCSIAFFIDGINIWNMSLLLLSQRGVWFESGNIPISIIGAPSNFTLEIGLIVDETLILDKRYDYDGDPGNLPDGLANSAYITVYLDDISFIKSTPPTPQEVKLEFTTGGENSSLAGSSGLYYALIVNQSYWTTSPISVHVVSNTTVSFEYESRLLSHRFADSNWRTDISSFGISYVVDIGQSPELTFYSYVGYLGGYEDPELIIRYPIDWENVSVSDPFLVDLTGSCSVSDGNLTVPSSILDRLGWWQFKLESPNYGKTLEIQKYDSSTGWLVDSQFRVGNETRPAIEIGTITETPSSLSNVNITWTLPNGTQWFQESISGGIDGIINGTSRVIDNSLAGYWQIEFIWSNGTEIAFLDSIFEVYHSANLISLDSIIETEVGNIVTGRVEFRDAENDDYLMEDAQIKGNWSAGSVTFSSNPTRKWWEVDLDTNLIGAGLFVVEVNATLPFFDIAVCQFFVLATNVTRLSSPNAPWTSTAWESSVVLTFHYETFVALASSWEPVSNSSGSVVATVNWTIGAWSVLETGVPGIYEVTIDTAVKPADSYLLNVSFSKPAHQARQMVLELVVTPQASSLTIYNGSSIQSDIEDIVVLKFSFVDSDGHETGDALLTVDAVSPSSGLGFSSFEPVSGETGNYSVSVTVGGLGVYTIRFLASKADYQPATAVFVLIVNDLPTSLSVTSGETAEMGLTDTFIATYHFEMYNGSPVAGAQINVLYSGPAGGLAWSAPIDEGSGDYSIQFYSTISGAYLITVAAARQYYQSDSVSFFLSVGEIATRLDVLNGTAKTIDFGTPYRLVLSYYNTTPYGLAGADIEIVSMDPSSGLDTSTITDEGSGIYSLILDPKIVGIYTMVFRANLTNHQSQFASFTLNLNDIITDLAITSGNSAEIGLTDSFEATIHYEGYNGTGIEGANVDVVYSGPSGLSWSVPSDDGQGNYSLIFDAVTSGTYLITISASKQYYQTSSSFFFLLVGDITTHLNVMNGTSKTINFGQTYRLMLYYYNNTPYGLEGANVSLLSITPDIGLSVGSVVEEGLGFYSLVLDPQVDDTFTLLFAANLTNHQTQFATFTLVSNPVPTELKALNSTTSLQVITNFTLFLRYETQGAIGISGANLVVLNPPTGLTLSNFEDIGNGYYKLYIFPIQTGSFQLSITSSKQFYQTESTSVFLVIGEINTQFVILNGTAGNIVFGSTYDLWFSFKNESSVGLEGAILTTVSITPSGLSTGPFIDRGEGLYSVLLNPSMSKTFSILIKANLSNHEVQFAVFTIVVEPVATVFRAMNATASISVDNDYRLVLLFEDDNNNGIEGALIELLTTPEGIAISEIAELGVGYYSVLLNPSAINMYNLLFRASLENHQNGSTSYILETTLVPTSLRFLDDISSGITYYGEEFFISVFYNRTDSHQIIESATVNASTQKTGISFIVEDTGTLYTIRVNPLRLGTHAITITITKDDYKSQFVTFTLTVLEIPTSLSWENQPEEILFSHTHTMMFSYVNSVVLNSTVVLDGTYQIIGSKINWVETERIGIRQFNFSITPNELGTYTLVFQFSAEGFEGQSLSITFTVIEVSVDVNFISATMTTEGLPLTVVVELFESGTNIPVKGADLRCRLDVPDSLWATLSEIAPGRYRGQLLIPIVETESSIDVLFFFSKENYQISLATQISILVRTDPFVKLFPAISIGGSSIAMLTVAFVGYRVSRTRKRKRNLRAIAIKQRFDDVKNMIGIIVLHKSSGLPIYSRTLKGGFDESMVSAFITAVSHFRSEFGMDEKHWDFQVIPISDIVSAVPTRNLICAFISASAPSKEQLVKMEAFGRAVGAMFDESSAIAPTELQDQRAEELFTSLFMDLMDGEFLTAYRKRESADIPKSMKCLSYVVRNMDHPEFSLDELARGMAMCGIEEGEAYLQVMDAIENGILEPANGSLPLELEPK